MKKLKYILPVISLALTGFLEQNISYASHDSFIVSDKETWVTNGWRQDADTPSIDILHLKNISNSVEEIHIIDNWALNEDKETIGFNISLKARHVEETKLEKLKKALKDNMFGFLFVDQRRNLKFYSYKPSEYIEFCNDKSEPHDFDYFADLLNVFTDLNLLTKETRHLILQKMYPAITVDILESRSYREIDDAFNVTRRKRETPIVKRSERGSNKYAAQMSTEDLLDIKTLIDLKWIQCQDVSPLGLVEKLDYEFSKAPLYIEEVRIVPFVYQDGVRDCVEVDVYAKESQSLVDLVTAMRNERLGDYIIEKGQLRTTLRSPIFRHGSGPFLYFFAKQKLIPESVTDSIYIKIQFPA